MPVGIDLLTVIAIGLSLLLLLGLLFGPSILSRYENWKIKKGLKG